MREITEDGALSGLADQVCWSGTLARRAVRARLFGSAADLPAFGRYRWLGALGTGGMGTVAIAHDPELDREVAIKLVEADDDRARARVVHEARAIARIADPHVVAVYDVGVAPGRVYIVMELVRGVTLRRWCTMRRRTWHEIVRMFVAAGQGLVAVHERGLLHRDFKPDNVVVGDDGRARLIDFGIARALGDATPSDERSQHTAPTDEDTLASNRLRPGTLAYMAPEQLGFDGIDHRADQFAFCVSLWEALFGARPGSRDSIRSIVEFAGAPPHPGKRDVPGRVYDVIAKGLQLDPQRRHDSMRALLDALARAEKRRNPALAIVLFGGATAALVAAVAPTDDDACADVGGAAASLWDAEARARVQPTFDALEGPFAREAWSRVDAGMKGFVARWQSERKAACRRDDPQLAMLAQRCFDWRLAGARALVGELERADAARLAATVERIAMLADPAGCRDPAVLAAAPPAADAELAAEVERVRYELAPLEAAHPDLPAPELLARAEALAARADELGFAPLQLECALAVAAIHARLGPYDAARDELIDLHARADAIAYASVAAKAASELAMVLAKRLAQPDEGLGWGRRAIEAARASGDPELLERAEGTIADAFAYAGRYDEALAAYEGLIARVDARCPSPCAARVDLEAQLATVLDALGQREQALAHATTAVELATASFGADHPGTAVARFKLCIAMDTLGDHDAALRECTAAHDVLARSLGERNPETAVVLGMLGTVEIGAGEIEVGRAHMRQSHATLVEQVGPAHPDAIGVLANLGWSYVERHDAQTAVEVVGPALAALEAYPEADPIGLAAIHHNYATALIDLGRNDEAVPSLQRAIALRSSVPGMRAEELVNNRTQLGGALFLSGHAAEAVAPLETAMYDERADDAIYNRVLRRYYLAGALRERDPGRARRIADDALAIVEDPRADAAGVAESVEIIAAIRELRARL